MVHFLRYHVFLTQRFVERSFFYPKINFDFLDFNSFVPQFYRTDNFFFTNNFSTQNIFRPKMFWTQFLDSEFFSAQNFLDPNLGPKIIHPNLFLCEIFFPNMFIVLRAFSFLKNLCIQTKLKAYLKIPLQTILLFNVV